MEQSSEREEVEDIFRKSRKTVRSPGKEKEGEGEIGDGDEKTAVRERRQIVC